jgi:hypothetical protein
MFYNNDNGVALREMVLRKVDFKAGTIEFVHRYSAVDGNLINAKTNAGGGKRVGDKDVLTLENALDSDFVGCPRPTKTKERKQQQYDIQSFNFHNTMYN